MRKMERVPAPDWLTQRYKKWGKSWEENCKSDKKQKFSWPTYNGSTINHHLLPSLKEMTDNHCAFCDICPINRGVITPTIEHFRPKDAHPFLVCYWFNLFLCCTECQKKGNRYDRALLKPDQDSYDFDEYFIIDFKTGKLQPNPIDEAKKVRAEKTIELYNLNEEKRAIARKDALAKYQSCYNKLKRLDELEGVIFAIENHFELTLVDCSYRFYIERGLNP